ncbi:MAG TPA: hypothetical protein VHE35_28965 [Kofleriaceae bacterium]|nr:hypothetical protein [Kofleriaceae bacterium]
MKPHETWDVLPHGELERVADNLYTVVGKLPMPLGETPRRMTIVKLRGGRLAIYSAIALDEPRMNALLRLGRPTFLIVPSAIHRIDAHPWKERFPDLVVVAPRGALDKIREVVAVDATACDLDDPRVRLEMVAGTDDRELAMLVDRTLVVNDLIFNLPRVKGLAGLGLRLLGFGPGHPAMPKLVQRRLVTDRGRMRGQLRAWAAMGLERILPAHGGAIDNPRETLLKLAGA